MKQHVAKASAAGYVTVCYEVINVFIKPQNFLLMGLICKLKGLYLIFFFFSMAEANFQNSRGKTISTTDSMNGSALGFLQRKKKQ